MKKLEDVIREYLLKSLVECNYNRAELARQSGVSIKTIRTKLKLYESQGYEIPTRYDAYFAIDKPVIKKEDEVVEELVPEISYEYAGMATNEQRLAWLDNQNKAFYG